MAGPIIRLKELITHTGLSKSVIYDRMDEKSPRYAPDFPKSFSLGGKAVGWYSDDVTAWLAKCASQRKSNSDLEEKSQFATSTKFSETPENTPTKPKVKRTPVAKTEASIKRLSTSSNANPRNLAEVIVEGGQINSKLQAYLQLKTWTPAMGAMLISGIQPPSDATEIPASGTGLDGKPLLGHDKRFQIARSIFSNWQEQQEENEEMKSLMPPVDFLAWCVEEKEIHTEWLALFLEVFGFKDSNAVDLTPARFAMLTSNSKLG